jgi:hypothetical protein
MLARLRRRADQRGRGARAFEDRRRRLDRRHRREDFFLARFNVNGSLDMAFGDDGTVSKDFGSDDFTETASL